MGKKFGGWYTQQITKLCFHKIDLADDYMTIDSDIYFLRKFDKSLFYNDGTLKTVARKLGSGSERDGYKKFYKLHRGNGEMEYRYFTSGYIKYIFNAGQLSWYDFVSSYALWSSEMLQEMEKFLKDEKFLDFADIIKLVPWEMQWYGQFVASKHPEKFFPLSTRLFTEIADMREEDKFKKCIPSNGWPGTYGMIYQPHAIGRKNPSLSNARYCLL